MSEPHSDRASAEPAPPEVRYPNDHVVAVINTPQQVESALEALRAGGFLESELSAVCGGAAADRLRASTGRSGFIAKLIRVAERLGVRDDEMELKDRYEQALRDGRIVVAVLALSEERKERAATILGEHGGHFINFLGRFTIEKIAS